MKINIEHIPGDLGPGGLADIWNLYHCQGDLLSFLNQQSKLYGPVFKMRFMGPAVFFLEAKASEEILGAKEKSFSIKSMERVLGEILKGSILLKEGPEHLRIRKVLQIVFEEHALKNYHLIWQEITRKFISSLPSKGGVAIYPEIERIMAHGVGQGIFNFKESEMATIVPLVRDLANGLHSLIQSRVLPCRFKRSLSARQSLISHITHLIENRSLSENGETIIDHLLRIREFDGNELTTQQIAEQLTMLVPASYYTSSIAISRVLYELANAPKWQTRLRSLNETSESEFNETFEWVYKESLRRHAPTQLITRLAIEDVTIAGHAIPKGTIVYLAPVVSHNSPTHWTFPENFDPERFSQARAEDKVNPFAFLPFGAGRHKCIGDRLAQAQARIFVKSMLQQFDWSLDDKIKEKFVSLPVGKPLRGLNLRLDRRVSSDYK